MNKTNFRDLVRLGKTVIRLKEKMNNNNDNDIIDIYDDLKKIFIVMYTSIDYYHLEQYNEDQLCELDQIYEVLQESKE